MNITKTEYWLFYCPILLFPILASTSTAYAQQSLSCKDIRYANYNDTDPNLTSLDIYTSSQADNWPVLIYVHGGGWSQGDKQYVYYKPDICLEKNYILVSVNYRLCPDANFPAHAEDLAAAIHWIYKNIENYQGNPNKIFLLGHSAGAHLVALVSTDCRYLQNHQLSLGIIKGTCPLDTMAYDIPNLANRWGGSLIEPYATAFTQDPNFWVFSSPITYCSNDRNIPPMIVAYSGGFAPYQNSYRQADAEAFVTKLVSENFYAEILPAPQKTHSEINQEFGAPSDTVAQTVFNFFENINRPATTDISFFAQHWLSSSPPLPYDFDDSNRVNFIDFAILTKN